MRILLTDGSGLTSRQVATRLDALGHHVVVLTSDPLCLARWTRHVSAVVRGPTFGTDPLRWLEHVLDVTARLGIDVVFPTQEQVAVLSQQLPRGGAGLRTAVPPFAALARLQDKVAARQTLEALSIPQPRSQVIWDTASRPDWTAFPAYVKAPLATGSTGVRRVGDAAELAAAVAGFRTEGGPDGGAGGGVLVQEAVDGVLVMAQCVFDTGALVAFAANERVGEGANGSASAKRSVAQPTLRDDLARLGAALHWHGALSVDAMVTGGRALVIDVNPRLVEPGNALAAGTHLVGALLAVAGAHRWWPSTAAPGPALISS